MNITNVERIALTIVANLCDDGAVVVKVRTVGVAEVDEEGRELFRVERVQEVSVVVEPGRRFVENFLPRVAVVVVVGGGLLEGAKCQRISFVARVKVDYERVEALACDELVEEK